MKKIIALTVITLAVAGTAFAGGIPSTTMGGKAFTFKQSSNVGIVYDTDGGTATGVINVNYALNTKNQSGNRVFSSSNQTSNVWYQEDDAWKGKAITDSAVTKVATPGSAADANYTGWSSM